MISISPAHTQPSAARRRQPGTAGIRCLSGRTIFDRRSYYVSHGARRAHGWAFGQEQQTWITSGTTRETGLCLQTGAICNPSATAITARKPHWICGKNATKISADKRAGPASFGRGYTRARTARASLANIWRGRGRFEFSQDGAPTAAYPLCRKNSPRGNTEHGEKIRKHEKGIHKRRTAEKSIHKISHRDFRQRRILAKKPIC